MRASRPSLISLKSFGRKRKARAWKVSGTQGKFSIVKSLFTISLAGIRTKQILREKAGCKQSRKTFLNVWNKHDLKGLWHASAHVRHLDFFPAEGFSSLLSGKKISFHRPLSAIELRQNLVKRKLDDLWAILVVYMCIFLKIHWEIGCRREKVRGEVYEAARDGSCFRLEAGWYPKEETKRQRNSGMRITDG